MSSSSSSIYHPAHVKFLYQPRKITKIAEPKFEVKRQEEVKKAPCHAVDLLSASTTTVSPVLPTRSTTSFLQGLHSQSSILKRKFDAVVEDHTKKQKVIKIPHQKEKRVVQVDEGHQRVDNSHQRVDIDHKRHQKIVHKPVDEKYHGQHQQPKSTVKKISGWFEEDDDWPGDDDTSNNEWPPEEEEEQQQKQKNAKTPKKEIKNSVVSNKILTQVKQSTQLKTLAEISQPKPPKKKTRKKKKMPVADPLLAAKMEEIRLLTGTNEKSVYLCYRVHLKHVPKIKKVIKDLTVIPKEAVSVNEKEQDEGKKKRRMMRNLIQKRKKTMRVFGETETHLAVPVQYGFTHFGPPDIDLRPRGLDLPKCVQFTANLWGPKDPFNQLAVADILKEHVETFKRGGLVELPTSSGKTLLILYLIVVILRKKALIVSPLGPVFTQLSLRIPEFVKNVRVGQIQGPTFDVKDKDIVVAMIQTMSSKLEWLSRPEMDEFEVLVFDEVDRIATKCYIQPLMRLSKIRYIFGFSATVERNDNMDPVLPLYCGDYIIRAPSATKQSQQTIVQRLYYEHGDKKMIFNEKTEEIDNSAMMRKLISDETRHQHVLEILQWCLNQGRRVCALLSHVEYGERLMADLKALNKDKKLVYYSRNFKPKEREFIDKNAHDGIGATYQLFSVGIDLGYLDTMVMVMPRRTVKQAIGRLRSISKWERKSLLIIDIIDKFGFYLNQAAARRTVYKNKKFIIPDAMTTDKFITHDDLSTYFESLLPITKEKDGG